MKTLLRSLVLLLMMTVLTGILYPLLVTGVAQVAFPGAANGSLVERDGQVVGSDLVGQPFEAPGHFQGRPSATAPFPYNAASSGGSNLGPTNPALADAVKARVDALRAADPGNAAAIPVDLVTTSASGLDPDLSPAAALYQVPRVARARGMSDAAVRALVEAHTRDRQLGVLGERRVNVLRLNLDLDTLSARM